jgi:hypothetical protein
VAGHLGEARRRGGWRSRRVGEDAARKVARVRMWSRHACSCAECEFGADADGCVSSGAPASAVIVRRPLADQQALLLLRTRKGILWIVELTLRAGLQPL